MPMMNSKTNRSLVAAVGSLCSKSMSRFKDAYIIRVRNIVSYYGDIELLRV